MSFVATAIIGGAVVGAVASKHSADTAAKSARNANQSLDAKFQQTRTDELPFITGGQAAMGRLSDLLGTSGKTDAEGYGSMTKPFTSQDYLNNQDPGYRFQLQQGDQAVQNRNAAGSGSMSGGALKDIASFNQEYAKTGYQAAYDRWTTNLNNTFARLSGVATLGQNAASQTGAQGVAVGQQQSANTTAAGNAAAAAQANMGNLAANAGTDLALMKYYKPTPPILP